MNIERLRTLAAFLPTVPEKRFSLGVWHRAFFEEECSSVWHKVFGEECSSVACAVGWAAKIPEFAEAGLSLGFTGTPRFESQWSWKAVEGFFGLKEQEARFLFDADWYRHGTRTTPKEVAERIALFLKGGMFTLGLASITTKKRRSHR